MTTDPQQKNENRERVWRIASELWEISDGNMMHCEECGCNVHRNDCGDYAEFCPECGSGDFREMEIHDYIDDELGVTFYTDCEMDYRGVRICIATGGPGIYIDNQRREVELFWWGDHEVADLADSAVEQIDDIYEDIWNSLVRHSRRGYRWGPPTSTR